MFNKIFRTIFRAKSSYEIRKEYRIPQILNFKFEFTKDGWIVATSDELPGFITQAKNGPELLEMINDGVLTYFDVPKKVGDIIYEQMNIEGFGIISLRLQQQAV